MNFNFQKLSTYIVQYSYPLPALAAAGSNTNVSTLTVPESVGLTLSSSAFSSLYFVVPPQVYLSTTGAQTLELQVTVKRTDGTTTTFGRLFNNNKYSLTVDRSKIKPIDLLLYKKNGMEYDETYLFWGNDDVVNAARAIGTDGIIDVHGENYAFPLNTIKLAYGTIYIRLPAGMTWAGDASYKVNGNARLLRFSGPKLIDLKVYVSTTIGQGRRDSEIFYAENITATTDAAIETEIMTTKATQTGDATIPVTWGNRIGSIAQTYSSVNGTEIVHFTDVVRISVDKTEMGTYLANASGSTWIPTAVASASSITVPENSYKNLAYNINTQVLRTNEAFIYTKNGTTTQKTLLQQNELAVMNGGIGFSLGSGATLNSVGHYNITTAPAEMVLFPYGYVQGAKAEAYNTTWTSTNSPTRIWYSVNQDQSSPSFGEVTIKKGGYTAYLGMSRTPNQSGDPCHYVKAPLMYNWRLMTAQEVDYFCKNNLILYNTDTSIKITYGGVSVVWDCPVCWNEKTPVGTNELRAFNSLWFAGHLPVNVAGKYYQVYVDATQTPPKLYDSALYPVDNVNYQHPWQHSRPICVRN